jgi:colanic acid/amylovoran biosynthesis glycosyltransferase
VKIVYVTSRYPFGPGEAFLGPEIDAHTHSGWDVAIFPAIRKGKLEHSDAGGIVARTAVPSGLAVARDFVRFVLGEPAARRAWLSLVTRPQPARIRLKNAVVLWRLGALIRLVRTHRPRHIHAHWGGASSTLAMAAARATEVPWSLSLHRWDIFENNLLEEKIGSAAFTRVISERAAEDVQAIVPRADPRVVHMGVRVPGSVPVSGGDREGCRFVCVASLIPVKDHVTLLHAFAAGAGSGDTLELIGDGPLEAPLKALAAELGIADRVTFAGLVDHDRLLGRLRAGEWNVVVLASSSTGSEHEGIPVSLMEAMASGVPAVATDSGATRELITEEVGLLVPPRDREALAEALRRLGSDPELRVQVGANARARVMAAFDAERVAETLRELMAGASCA